MSTPGIHHVTAISGPARRNLAFYTEVLGLRLVKKTVNFDDPGTYHLYFGDEAGSPGSIITFFPWAHAAPGRIGIGETQETLLRVPQESLGWWMHRLIEKGVEHDKPEKRFGETIVGFKDPDGMRLALVGIAGAAGEPAWAGSPVPVEHAIRGTYGVTLLLADAAPTARILTNVLGFQTEGTEGVITRLRAPSAAAGAVVDLRAVGGFPRGRLGRGTVHHVAFRAADDAAQAAMVKRLREEHGIAATEQKDRNYFRSVYFREPGGVLFEIATDAPGFAADEAADALGTALKLPAFLESRRSVIETTLPDLT
ncbi:ring-cleaving dioxygenase [Chthonobacter albigriseus]|uniref:ring-cleaving dioxygenase n=1 Tax=Chthonobacter albigriseus TaxID=1683161 RepID=UPI0015EF435D|nr:ring-cleaving dioxygenase [Chthonobacter albigriseus]